jgi:ADP-ribose pyrophosphatase YjhB (NUDIX family)
MSNLPSASKLPTTSNPWRTHHSQEVFANEYVKLVRNDVTRPSGNPGLYTVVHFQRVAVAIIPVDDEGYTWLVGQFRYPHNTYEWEVPEGGAELDEAPEACAHRELREEAGLLAATLTPILEMQLSNSTTDEVSHTFLATGLTTPPQSQTTRRNWPCIAFPSPKPSPWPCVGKFATLSPSPVC